MKLFTKEHFKVVLPIEDISRGCKESKEQGNQTQFGTLRTCFFDWDRRTLDNGKGWGILLNLHLGLFHLANHLLVNTTLKLGFGL
jgi:hypothetical protein